MISMNIETELGHCSLYPRALIETSEPCHTMPYADKYKEYWGQNWLAKTLHKNAYNNNPSLRRLIELRGIEFKAQLTFGRTDLEEREKVIAALAEQVWHTNRIAEEATRVQP
jgi:hypothetical protein